MKTKRYVMLAGAMLIAFFLTSCSHGRNNRAPDVSTGVSYALGAAVTRRADITKPHYEEFIPFTHGRIQILEDVVQLIETKGGEDNFLEFVLHLMTPIPRVSEISAEDALFDAETLLFVMRTNYGAYTFYGGDDVFMPLFDQLYETILETEIWRRNDFAELLNYNLSQIIYDNHFIINGIVLGGQARRSPARSHHGVTATIFEKDYRFYRSENGFLSQENNLYVIEIQGHAIEDVLRLSIDDEGELFYAPVVIIPGHVTGPRLSLQIIYENGEQSDISLFRRGVSPVLWNVNSNPLPFLMWFYDIPVITLPFMASHPNEEPAGRFLSYGKTVKNEPAIIIDLRSNRGRNSLLASQFLNIVTGEVVLPNSTIFHLGNHADFTRALADMPNYLPTYRPLSDFETYLPSKPLDDFHFVFNYGPRRLIQNDQLIILLTDRNTGSAGEGFADLALNLENSLIIGQNTEGVYQKSGDWFFICQIQAYP